MKETSLKNKYNLGQELYFVNCNDFEIKKGSVISISRDGIYYDGVVTYKLNILGPLRDKNFREDELKADKSFFLDKDKLVMFLIQNLTREVNLLKHNLETKDSSMKSNINNINDRLDIITRFKL